MKWMLLLLLSGCASLQYAGNSDYSIKPFFDEDRVPHCCEVQIHNGKEIGYVEATMSVKSDGSYKVHFVEQSIKAFEGQRIAKDALKDSVKAGVATGITALKIIP